jgi:hypothetical protein
MSSPLAQKMADCVLKAGYVPTDTTTELAEQIDKILNAAPEPRQLAKAAGKG